MDGKGRYMDNIFVERLWRSLKYEEVDLNAYASVAEAKAGAIATPDYYDRLAVAQALSQLDAALAAFTGQFIRASGGEVEAWLAGQGDRLGRVKATLEEIAGEGTCTVSRLLVAAGQLSDLAAAGPAAPSPSARTGPAKHRAKSAASDSNCL